MINPFPGVGGGERRPVDGFALKFRPQRSIRDIYIFRKTVYSTHTQKKREVNDLL